MEEHPQQEDEGGRGHLQEDHLREDRLAALLQHRIHRAVQEQHHLGFILYQYDAVLRLITGTSVQWTVNITPLFEGGDRTLHRGTAESRPAPRPRFYHFASRLGRIPHIYRGRGEHIILAFRPGCDKEKGAAQGRLPEPEAKQLTNKCQPIQILLSVLKRVCNTN